MAFKRWTVRVRLSPPRKKTPIGCLFAWWSLSEVERVARSASCSCSRSELCAAGASPVYPLYIGCLFAWWSLSEVERVARSASCSCSRSELCAAGARCVYPLYIGCLFAWWNKTARRTNRLGFQNGISLKTAARDDKMCRFDRKTASGEAVFVFGPVFARGDRFPAGGSFPCVWAAFAGGGIAFACSRGVGSDRFRAGRPLLHVRIAFARAGGGFQPTNRLPIW